MGRFLVVVPPLAGHVNPAAGVAAELRRRGHAVAWCAHEAVVGELLGEDPLVYAAGDGFLTGVVEHLTERETLRGPASLKFLWERVLVPLALDMADPVRKAVADFRPDVVLSDQQAFAGAMAAAERGLPWVVCATTGADLADPPMLPKIGEWMRQQVARLCEDAGFAELATGFDPRRSPHLTLVCSTPALAGEVVDRGSPLAFVGPVLVPRPQPVPFPWEWLDRHETNVLVTLGTVSHDIGARFLDRVLEAVGDQPFGTVMVAPPERFASPPGNVLIERFVPQLELLPRMRAVVCHAGHNTTVEALAAGVPLVCAPIRDDQPVTAAQVVRAGAGVRVSFGRARPGDLDQALSAVLHQGSYRANAERVAASFHAAGGAASAADRLERLLAARAV